jgi:predicted transcriptional regulator
VSDELDRAVALLGPLEGRIMRAVWTGQVNAPFVVRDVQTLMPELAYTTVMTTLRRLADKTILTSLVPPGHKAHQYRAAGTVRDFLAHASDHAAAQIVERYGDAALAAFASRIAALTPEQRRRLEDLQQ